MKISQVISVLNNRMETHGDVDVEIVFEGQGKIIDPSNIYMSLFDSLFIDAEGNVNKSAAAVDPNEGEEEALNIGGRDG